MAASAGAMVGRATERGVLDRLLAAATGGSGATVLIEGEAGIGKTRLVQNIVEAARRRGVSAVVGAARPFEATRPFGAVSEALHLRRGSSDARRAEIARLLVGEGAQRTAPPGPDTRYRIVEEIIDLVEVQSQDAPLLLAFEDLHWADDSTVLVVRTLMDRITYLPVLLVGTLRPSPRSADLDLLLADAPAAGATVLQLAPLPRRDIDDLVRAETGRPPGPDLAELVNRAAGNPLWVVEIIRALLAEGVLQVRSGSLEVTTATLPDSFRQLVLRRLRYLPDATIRTLRVAAVLGDTFSLVDLATVTGRRAVDLVEDLAAAVQSRLLGEDRNNLTFRHQLVHDTIYEDIPRSGRIAMHRDAARVLADAGAPIAQVAAHVLRGAVPGDAQAVGWLRVAARDALPRAPDVAIDILRRAEDLVPVGHPDADLVIAELIEALLRAGRVAECAASAEALLSRPHLADVEPTVRLFLLEALSLQNRALELIAQAEAALTTTSALSDADRALILAQASYGRTFSGDLTGGEKSARAALELAQRSSDVGMMVWSLTTLSFAVKTQGRYGEAVDLAEQAVRMAVKAPDEQGRLRHPHFFLGMAMCDADRMTEAREAYRNGIRECASLGSSWILPDIQLNTGELHFELGEWDDALAELEAGLAAAAERGNQVAIAQSLGYVALIHAARGDRRGAQAALAPLQSEFHRGALTYGMEIFAYALAMLTEAEGQPRRAYESLWSLWQRDANQQIRRFHRHLAPPLVRLALALDHPDDATAVVEVVEEAAALATDVLSMRAVALRCRGLVGGDPETMLEAVALVRSGPRVSDQVATLEDAARVLASAGRTTEAQSLLLEALELCAQLAATAWAVRVRAALRDLGMRTGVKGARRRPATGWASLTDTERAVARLVADGLTNREVGTRLFISPNTVNTHLRHVFQKLGVSSRGGLTAAMLHQNHPFK